MSSIYLFNIASQRTNWLSLRQEAITGNITHANTPGYAARDVQPFEAVMQSEQLAVATSDPAHVAQTTRPVDGITETQEDGWHVYNSGNSVSIEKELVKAGEVSGAYALNNGVIKAFHRMLLTSAKG